jgi:hypothetical protein
MNAHKMRYSLFIYLNHISVQDCEVKYSIGM